MIARRRTLFIPFAIIAIFVLGRPTWRVYVCGLALVLVGQAIRVWAAGYLKKCAEVCSGGPFGFVRNPLYIGSFFVLLGYCVMANSLLVTAVFVLLFCLFHGAAIAAEESHLTRLFGDRFLEYCRSAPRLVPRWPRGRSEDRFSMRQVIENREHASLAYSAVIVAAFALKIAFGM